MKVKDINKMEKKILPALMLIMLILIIGCAKEIKEIAPEEPETADTAEEPQYTIIEERVVAEAEEIMPEKEQEEVRVIYTNATPDEIPVPVGEEEEGVATVYTKKFGSKEQSLYDKHNKVKGYSYFDMQPFKDASGNKVFGMYSIKGDLIKVEFYDTTMQFPGTVNKFNLGLSEGIFFGPGYYNIVLINKRTKNASAFCLRQECMEYGRHFDVPYQLYMQKTPYEYILEINNMEILEERQEDSRFIIIVRSKFDNGERILWLDKFYALPVQVEEYIDSGEKIYEFKAMSFTPEDDTSFMYPFGKPIVKQ